MAQEKQDLSTGDLFAAYLRQLEQLGVDRVYWKPPEKIPPRPKAPTATADSTASAPDSGAKAKQLAALQAQVKDCTKCGLHQGRTQTVFGGGNSNADLVLVGEAPGYQEDKQGVPFVGKAGHLLTRILKAMHLERTDVFICNVIKCRPPENRNPNPEEIITCEPYLIEQLRIIQPKVICAMGKFAAQTLLQSKTPISRLRGQWREYQGIPLMPTFHPAYLLRNPNDKRLVWDDMQQIMQRLGISL